MAVAQIHFQRVCYNQASPRFYLTAMKKTLSDILVTGFGLLKFESEGEVICFIWS